MVHALRGQTVTLECIPKGLWVFMSPVCVFSLVLPWFAYGMIYLFRSPTPEVEWKKSDGSLQETGGDVKKWGRWLRFSSISTSDDGEYSCRAHNGHGSITHSFTVTVEGKMQIFFIFFLSIQVNQNCENSLFPFSVEPSF